MPSGATPQHIFTCPEAYGGERYSVPVPREVIQALRENLDVSQEEAFHWVSDEFMAAAEEVFFEIGSPTLSLDSGWDTFVKMDTALTRMYDDRQ